tara:strand:- start:204 stop:443 length:240 start_codon:yes stop_codon:yes gene_type:complete
MTTYHCTYTYDFPIDEFGRLGGFYSLADLPIVKHEKMVRVGILEAKNEEHQMYKVRDKEKNFTEWVPMTDVEIGEEVSA